MHISFDSIQLGQSYDRPTLAKLWGYKTWSAIGKGITPVDEHVIILFVTEEKQEALPQYLDRLDGDTLWLEGETQHRNDDRLINAKTSGDEIHLFHRHRHHLPFVYCGCFELTSFDRDTAVPSRFVFQRVTGSV